jgi:hypothetical protein
VHGASSLRIDGSLDADQLVPDGETLATTVAAAVVELIAAAPTGKPRQQGAVQ